MMNNQFKIKIKNCFGSSLRGLKIMTYIDMIILILISIILALEVISNRKYQKDLEACYKVLLQQQYQINDLESKLKKFE